MSVQVQHRRDSTTNIEGVTPAVAELGYDTTKKEALIGDGLTAGGIRLPKKNVAEWLAPAQIVANQDNYSPTGLKHAAVLSLTADAARDITGIVPLTVTDSINGRMLTLYNAGAFAITLKNASVASTAANRFDLLADIVMAAKQAIELVYNATDQRWRLHGSTAGQGIGDAAVLARHLAASSLLVGPLVNGYLDWSVAGNALTVALKTRAGADPSPTDPVLVVMRSVTATDGKPAIVTVTAALSLTLSTGSSLGFTNGTPGRLWAVLFDDGGTLRIGLINCVIGTSIYPLAGSGIASSTAEGGSGSADSAYTMYTGSAVTDKPFAVMGYATWETGLATAGTWNVGPTRAEAFRPGVPLPGQVVQVAQTEIGSLATGTTIIPYDDTIPQNTEGDQFLSQAITPTSAANLARLRAQVFVSPSNLATITVALFRDSDANALVATSLTVPVAHYSATVGVEKNLAFTGTAATTFKARAGAGGAGTVTLNGAASARLLGGVGNSFLRVEEVMG